MTAPIIPAGQWPEWADRFCWDEGGSGRFYGAFCGEHFQGWNGHSALAKIPMPAGWDWRVPVMRPQPAPAPAPAPAIDLEQFIALAKFGEEHAFTAERRPHSMTVYSQARRLLALIDEQGKCQTCGTTIKPHPMTGTICDCALPPAKGEGE